MFWDKGYAPSANIEALLEKENTKLEEFLDEEDILQECKTQKKNLVNYFTRPEVIRRLVELVTTEPSEDVPMVQRFRYANMSCEILTLGLPSLDEKLLSDTETLQLLYSYLENEPPLNPLLSSFFSKTFSMLFTKKPEQDWFLYQHMCLKLLEYIKSQKNFLDLICKHFDTPVIPDLIMQMMKDIEGGQLKRNLYEWLTEDKIVERLIAILRNPQETDKHANVAEFFCDLIKQGRAMRQTEQENDSFEPAFDGSNPILNTIESAQTIEALLNVILEPNALESAILSGISVVLTLIKPISFTDEPNTDRQRLLHKRDREFHQQLEETVITVTAPRLQEFVNVLKNPPAKPPLEITAAVLTPPFGRSRLQICRLFTALLETKHETIQHAICSTDYFSLLLQYFKDYCWNNFLHSELEKSLSFVFFSEASNNTNSTACTEKSYGKQMTEEGGMGGEFFWLIDPDIERLSRELFFNEGAEGKDVKKTEENPSQESENSEIVEPPPPPPEEAEVENETNKTDEEEEITTDENTIVESANANTNVEEDKSKAPVTATPTEMQTHLIKDCHLISKLVDLWLHNEKEQGSEKGRRLGYMGHLIKILRNITLCILESEHIDALITTSFSVDDSSSELEQWKALIDAETGELTNAVKLQSKMLANCNPHEENDYMACNSKDFLTEASNWEIGGASSYSNMGYNNDIDGTLQDIVFNMDNDQNLFQFGRNIDDDEDDDDDGHGDGSGDGLGLFTKNSTTLNNLSVDPWDVDVNFSNLTVAGGAHSNNGTSNWADFNADNFADFDAHFSTLCSDLGMPHTQPPDNETSVAPIESTTTLTSTTTSSTTDNVKQENQLSEQQHQEQTANNDANADDDDDVQMAVVKEPSPDNASDNDLAEYDNNANVEKSTATSNVEKISDTSIDFSTMNSIGTTTSLVNRLQSVLLDGEEDYEDDEGMWTKPLGGSSGGSDENESDEHPLPIINGPSSKQLTLTVTAEQQKLAANVTAVAVETASTVT